MSIFDKIKPKYRHSNPKVRLKGIEELDDDAILLHLSLDDKVKEVRKAAFNKIKFPGYFPLIAVRSHDKDIREESFNKITDSEGFAEVARLTEDKIFQKKAIDNITKINLLEKLKSDTNQPLHQYIDSRIDKILTEDVGKKEPKNNDP